MVVDFGTAVTFDVVSAEGDYIGGVIAPGLEVDDEFSLSTHGAAAEIDFARTASAIGKTTRDAMMAGAIYGYRGLVREILSRAFARESFTRKKVRVVATGGYAQLIARRIAGNRSRPSGSHAGRLANDRESESLSTADDARRFATCFTPSGGAPGKIACHRAQTKVLCAQA